MNEEKKETSLKFENKDEITRAISCLTPFTKAGNTSLIPLTNNYQWAEDKVKELAKLL